MITLANASQISVLTSMTLSYSVLPNNALYANPRCAPGGLLVSKQQIMAMTYSSQKLADALQQVVNQERNNDEAIDTTFSMQISKEDLAAQSNPSVSRFIHERAAYRESTRTVSIGHY